jgi:PadR family transcriptional regulator PadR
MLVVCNILYIAVYYVIRFAKACLKKEERMVNPQKEVQTKLAKGLLDLIIFQYLNQQPMHGYQIITKIRKSFGVYFGPSTIYPFMAQLEKKGYIKSQWNTDYERPRKIYTLTQDGKAMLNFTEDSLNLLCQKIGTPTSPVGTVESVTVARKAILPPLTIR